MNPEVDPDSLHILRKIVDHGGHIVFLTGAGISAESGIPTFRGPEGFWTVGSRVYQPEELATWSTFSKQPQLVWPWYLWRRQTCRSAAPNPAHFALAEIEAHLGHRCTLVTQNVDGLHLRAGNTTDRTHEIHGNIDYFRCAQECSPRRALPDLAGVDERAVFHDEWSDSLHCVCCNSWMRPHVLWFDERYDEENYRIDSTVHAMNKADALVVVGTTGATSLPAHMLRMAMTRGIPVFDINPDPNPFAQVALQGPGAWLQTTATEGMAQIQAAITNV